MNTPIIMANEKAGNSVLQMYTTLSSRASSIRKVTGMDWTAAG